MPQRARTRRSMTRSEWGMLVTLSVLWGASFFFTGIAVKELPTFTVVACRVTLASIILLLGLRLGGTPMRRIAGLWAAFLPMGLLNNAIPFSLIVWGQSHIASGLAAILNATTPLFTAVAAHALTADEKLTGARMFGVIGGWVGVVIMIGGDALQSLGTHVVAQLACVAAALSYALAGIFGRRFTAMGVSSLEAAAGQVTASSIILIPVMLVTERPWTLPVPGLATIGALLGIGVLSTALAYVLYFRILATAGATNLLLVTFLIPVSAIMLGVAMLGEALQAKQLVGMVLIGCGLAAIDGRPWRMLTMGGERFKPVAGGRRR